MAVKTTTLQSGKSVSSMSGVACGGEETDELRRRSS